MGIERLIQVCAILAAIAVASGNLPGLLAVVRRAQIHWILETQASKWGSGSQLEVRCR